MRFLALFCLCAFCFAQEIKNIKFDGLLRVSDLIAKEIVGMKVGEQLDKQKLNKAIIAFYKQDYFDDVYADFSNGILTFHFTNKPTINNIEVKGYGNDTETEEITKLINLKKGDSYDIFKEEYAKDVIITNLEDKGLYGSIIEVESTRIEDSINLIFNVNKGENIIIKKSVYSGASLEKDELESLSANRERHSWLGWLPWFPSGELKLRELEYDNLRIQDIYMRKGYLDASVSQPLLSADFRNYNATLLYKIKEGERYSVSEVHIVKNDDVENIFSDEELSDLIKLKSDEFFNIETARYDMEVLKSHIMDEGYAFARVNPDLNKDEINHKVAVTYVIDIGKKVAINDVIISGNTISSDRIVRRELLIAPGDIYSITDIRKSENALRRTGFFTKVNISEIRVSEDSMNLLIEVEEGNTGEVMAGIGYGSYDGFMINGSIRERNLFGTGIGVQLAINWSKPTQMYNIGLSNPRILDSEYSAALNIFHSRFRSYDGRIYSNENLFYSENTTGFSASVGRNLSDAASVNLTYGLSKSSIIDNGYGYSAYYPPQGIWKSYISPGIYFDNTDDYYFPKNGAILQASVEFAGLGGNAQYTKLFGKAGLYYHLKNLINFDLILRYKAQIGAIYPFKKQDRMTASDKYGIPITDAFYMGGIGTVRGFKNSMVSPTQCNYNNPLWFDCLRIGGNYMFANSVEISYGIFEAINMRIAAFFDFGMIGKKNFNEIKVMSAGLALEWVSPIGPLVFVFPFPIQSSKLGLYYNKNYTSNFEFTMGTRF